MLSITISDKVKPEHVIGYVYNILKDHYDIHLASKYLGEVKPYRYDFEGMVRVTRQYIDVVVVP